MKICRALWTKMGAMPRLTMVMVLSCTLDMSIPGMQFELKLDEDIMDIPD